MCSQGLGFPPARWRVLIFPGGTEIGLELRQALMWCKEVELYSAGASVPNHAPFVFAHHTIVPPVSEPGWLDALNSVIEAHSITHVFPGHDDVIVALAENTTRIKARVVTSPLETCRLTRSKTKTLRWLEGIVPVPRVFATPADVLEYPVFVKPDQGQGSQNAVRADNLSQLKTLIEADPSRIIIEYLSGPEFTVDCFSDRDRGLMYASGRDRRRIRSGIAMGSVLVNDSRFEEYAKRIAERMALHGAWFYQVKMSSDGELRLLEVAPRVGGTSALSRARGVNLPLLSLYENDRIPVKIVPNTLDVEIDRALINRFRSGIRYDTIYVDFDDTLVVGGRVNTELVKLLFQAFNRGVRIILITRHAGELGLELRRFRVDGIFDEIIHIRDGSPKSNFIKSKEAVFIDDSYAEREAVARLTGVPVFDPGMIETLFDDRVNFH